LYYATQVIELGHPTLIALNMVDVAEANGHQIDAAKLAQLLGVGVLPVVASTSQGVPELRQRIVGVLRESASTPKPRPALFSDLPAAFKKEADDLAVSLAETFHERLTQAKAEALLILSNEKALASSLKHYPEKIQQAVAAARQRLDSASVDWRGAPIEA